VAEVSVPAKGNVTIDLKDVPTDELFTELEARPDGYDRLSDWAEARDTVMSSGGSEPDLDPLFRETAQRLYNAKRFGTQLECMSVDALLDKLFDIAGCGA
jgi:hypothetical protein